MPGNFADFSSWWSRRSHTRPLEKTGRRRFRFGLRSLFAILFAIAMALAWYSYMRPHWQAIRELRAMGVTVEIVPTGTSGIETIFCSWFSPCVVRVSQEYTRTFSSTEERETIAVGMSIKDLHRLEAFEGLKMSPPWWRGIAPGLRSHHELRRLHVNAAAWDDPAEFFADFPEIRELIVDVENLKVYRIPIAEGTLPGESFDCGWLLANRQLESLEIRDFLPINLGRLAELPNLKRIGLSYTDSSNLEFAARIDGLKELGILRAPANLDLSALARMPALEGLNIRSNSFVSFVVIQHMTNLRTLSIAGPAGDLDRLEGFDSLQILKLRGANSYSMVPGKFPKNLWFLEIREHQLPISLAPIGELSRLRVLRIENVQDLKYLANLQFLEGLSLAKTTIETADPFIALQAILEINLGECVVEQRVLDEIRAGLPKVRFNIVNCRGPDGKTVE